ncbi:MAG: preprotein translocase subunit SecE [Phycisphaerales bacterium]|nr:preprotein translocase subunit SecE [Phycisphaerales bacterium]
MYKIGQGYWTRVISATAGGVIALLGGWWLHDIFETVDWGVNPIYLSWGIGGLFVTLCCPAIYLWTARTVRTVDFLVATETEMKKVSWPTRKEVSGSTVIVIFTSLVIAFFCYFFDQAFFLLFVQLRVLNPGT